MLDGIQDNSNYPADFFIDLVFTEARTADEKEAENKNKTWQIISQTCAEKRRLVGEAAAAEPVGPAAGKVTPGALVTPGAAATASSLEEEKKAFVIDSPGLSPQIAPGVAETVKGQPYQLDDDTGKEEQKLAAPAPVPIPKGILGELEQEALRMHKELMEESKPEPKKVVEPPQQKIAAVPVHEAKAAETLAAVAAAAEPPPEEKMEKAAKGEVKKEEKTAEEDQDLDQYLSSIKDLIEK